MKNKQWNKLNSWYHFSLWTGTLKYLMIVLSLVYVFINRENDRDIWFA